MTGFSWEQRIDRANELKQKYPAAENILSFYWMIARFQGRVFERLVHSPSVEIRDLMKDLARPLPACAGVWEPDPARLPGKFR